MAINLDRLHEYKLVAPDVETTGLHWKTDKMFGIALAVDDGERIHSGYWDVREKPRILELLRDELPRCKRVINHSMKFDSHFLMNEDIRVPLDNIECTMVRAAIIDEWEHSFSLDALAKKYLGRAKESAIYQQLADMFGGKATREVQMKNLHRAPSKLVAAYAAPDPELALLLWKWQEKEIEKQKLHKVWDLERRLTPVLIEMERQGVRVDEQRAHDSIPAIAKQIAKAQSTLNRLAGGDVNANSPPQMQRLFGVKKTVIDESTNHIEWRTDKGFLLENTDAGGPSIGKDALKVMAAAGDTRAAQILVIRQMTKAQQFLDQHILGHAINGYVHPNYNQTRSESGLGTGTGRFSIDDPALQQIPKRDRDIAAIVRSCFIPEDDHDWACSDWEQKEFRMFAHYTQDPTILQAYADDPDTDYHQIVSDITGIPRDAKHAGDTANAKQINLGLVFGMGQGEMAYNMNLDYTTRRDKSGRVWKTAGPQAAAIFDKYHSAIPGVKKLLEQASSIARARGYVMTVMERHIRFPGGKATHKAAGLVFQGSSADSMKVKMIAMQPIAKREGFRMLLTVHDELDFSLPKKKSRKLAALIKKEMETFDGSARHPFTLRVPIKCSMNVADNWWNACK